MRIPDFAHEYAINAANYRHWNPAVRAFVDDCFNGADSDDGRGFNFMLERIARRRRRSKFSGAAAFCLTLRTGGAAMSAASRGSSARLDPSLM